MNIMAKNSGRWRRNDEIPMELETAKALRKKNAKGADAEVSAAYEALKKEHEELLQACEIWKEGVAKLGTLRKEIIALKVESARRAGEAEALKEEAEALKSQLFAAGELERSLTETRDEAVKKVEALEARLAEAEKYDIKSLLVENVKLNNALADAQRQVQDLESIQQAAVSKNSNYWHYVLPEKKPRMPKIGDKVLCLCVNVKEYGERIADRRYKDLGNTYYSELFYSGEYHFRGLPSGHLVVAWRPLFVHDKEKINIAVMDVIMSSLNDHKAFQSLFVDAGRCLQNPDEEKKRLERLRKDLRSATNKKIAQIFDNNNRLARDVLNIIRKDKNNAAV